MSFDCDNRWHNRIDRGRPPECPTCDDVADPDELDGETPRLAGDLGLVIGVAIVTLCALAFVVGSMMPW